MPTNQIIVEFEEGAAKCRVWDGAGTEHDVTAIFQQLRDLTTKDMSSASMAMAANSLQTAITFIPTQKEITFAVKPAVIEQILQMG